MSGVTLGREGVGGLERWYGVLPLVMLAVGGGIGLITQPVLGSRPGGYPALLTLLAVTAVWVWWWDLGPGRHRQDRWTRATYWVVRSVLAFVLTLVNPLLAFFAFVGYFDVTDVFRGRGRAAGFLLVALTLAGSQSGGLPPQNGSQTLLFVVLVVVNIVVSGTFLRFSVHQQDLSDARAVTITELERVNRELGEAMSRNEALASRVAAQQREAGVQQERQRLAAEIHDTIAQGLAGVVTQLRAAREVSEPRDARAHLDSAESLARESLTAARRSVHDLVPAALSGRSLSDALDRTVAAWSRSHSTRTDLTVSGTAAELHPEVEATVVRITQEALANVARHARAQRVGVTLTYADAEVLLDVRDDGVGFDTAAVAASASFGLRGMRQRAERVAGHLVLEAHPGRGTAVSARLPAVRPAESSERPATGSVDAKPIAQQTR